MNDMQEQQEMSIEEVLSLLTVLDGFEKRVLNPWLSFTFLDAKKKLQEVVRNHYKEDYDDILKSTTSGVDEEGNLVFINDEKKAEADKKFGVLLTKTVRVDFKDLVSVQFLSSLEKEPNITLQEYSVLKDRIIIDDPSMAVAKW